MKYVQSWWAWSMAKGFSHKLIGFGLPIFVALIVIGALGGGSSTDESTTGTMNTPSSSSAIAPGSTTDSGVGPDVAPTETGSTINARVDVATPTVEPQPTAEAVPTQTPTAEPAAPSLTAAQKNAVRSAQAYLKFKGFSRQGLIDQLSSQYGDQYAVEDATIAVDSLDVDWAAQAVRSAEAYLNFKGFSCQGLIDQLSSEYGDQYTVEQATFGATQAKAC